MIDQPTETIPSERELELWELDLAKRICRDGRDRQDQLARQSLEAVEQYEQSEATID